MPEPSKISPTEEAQPQSAPDWSTIELRPICPLCSYSLYGLGNPRCPECGYPFDWKDVLERRLEPHPYLFEFHPEANLRSFIKTAKKACSPSTFWSELHPQQRPILKRLRLYWLFSTIIFCCLIVSQSLLFHVTQMNSLYVASAMPVPPILSSTIVNYFSFGFWTYDLLIYALPVASLPWIVFGILQIFRVSMRRARISPRHVLRCTIYGLDPMLCCVFVLVCAVYDLLCFAALAVPSVSVEMWICSPLLLMYPYRLSTAYRDYLRFDHPTLTVVAATVIVLLMGFNIYCALTLW